MAMLGQEILPESVNERRRQVRQRVQEVRQPLRERREGLVPGPDVVGTLENNLMDLRDRVASRESVVARLKERRGGSDEQTDKESDSGNSGSTDSSHL